MQLNLMYKADSSCFQKACPLTCGCVMVELVTGKTTLQVQIHQETIHELRDVGSAVGNLHLKCFTDRSEDGH